MKLYKQLAAHLTVLIRQGALKPGDRVPSVQDANLPIACGSITARNGRRRASGPSRPWGPSCDHSGSGGVRLRLSFMG
jgi:hypothetical protein